MSSYNFGLTAKGLTAIFYGEKKKPLPEFIDKKYLSLGDSCIVFLISMANNVKKHYVSYIKILLFNFPIGMIIL